MSDGIDRKRIRRHLLIFSLAAPLMAIFTFVLLQSVRTIDAIAVCLLIDLSLFAENSRHLLSGLDWFGNAVQCRNISIRGHRSRPARSSITLRRPTISHHRTAHSYHRLLFSDHSLHGP